MTIKVPKRYGLNYLFPVCCGQFQSVPTMPRRIKFEAELKNQHRFQNGNPSEGTAGRADITSRLDREAELGLATSGIAAVF